MYRAEAMAVMTCVKSDASLHGSGPSCYPLLYDLTVCTNGIVTIINVFETGAPGEGSMITSCIRYTCEFACQTRASLATYGKYGSKWFLSMAVQCASGLNI